MSLPMMPRECLTLPPSLLQLALHQVLPHQQVQPATPTPTPTQKPNLPSPDLSFYCISSTTSSGFNVQIQGSITYNGQGLPSAGIQLFDSVTGGATWQDLTYVVTGNDGTFTCTWNPSASGNYVIRAIWAGDNEYSNATATYNFAVQPTNNQDQNVFSVTSNSTLTSLTFDSATNQLTFGVSGPSGTTGLTTVCIPQSLITDVSRINVMLDGNPINYTSASEGNVWILTFTYSHSSHTIVIALGSAATATSPVGYSNIDCIANSDTCGPRVFNLDNSATSNSVDNAEYCICQKENKERNC